MDKLKELTLAEKIVVGASLMLLVASFLPWFKFEIPGYEFLGDTVGGESHNFNGWDGDATPFFLGPFPVILGLLMAAHILIGKFAPDTKLPELPWDKVHLGGGIAAAALVILKLAVGGPEIMGMDVVDRAYGLFIAAAAAAALAYGGFLMSKQLAGGSSAADAAPEAPPAGDAGEPV